VQRGEYAVTSNFDEMIWKVESCEVATYCLGRFSNMNLVYRCLLQLLFSFKQSKHYLGDVGIMAASEEASLFCHSENTNAKRFGGCLCPLLIPLREVSFSFL
jgi:hypothetical protein